MRKPNLIGRPQLPLDPRESVPEQLARVERGTRVRIFHRDGERKLATSGTVVSLEDGTLIVTALQGGCPLRVATADITCMYLPEEVSAED